MRIVGRRVAVCLAGLLLGSAAPCAAAISWTVEDGSVIRFTFYQQGAPVEGSFRKFTAEVVFDPDDLGASRVAAKIDAASITTGHKDRDTALRSASFFDVNTWPSATFRSDHLARRGDHYEAEGQLTIRNVTKDVVLPFQLTIEQAAGRRVARASGELTISRLDYGIGQGDFASTKTVGEDVVIQVEILASAP